MPSIEYFVLDTCPLIIATLVAAGFSYVACYNFWYLSSPESDEELQHQHRILSTSQRWKYTLIALITVCGMTYGVISGLMPFIRLTLDPDPGHHWYKTLSIMSNRVNHQQVYSWTREFLDLDPKGDAQALTMFAYTVPATGIQVFLLFGLGFEVQKTYIGWWQTLGIGISETRAFGWVRRNFVVNVRWWRGPSSQTGSSRLQRSIMSGWLSCFDSRWRWWGGGHPRVNPGHFTPFQPDDIVLDDLRQNPWGVAAAAREPVVDAHNGSNSSSSAPLPPPLPPPPPPSLAPLVFSSSKRPLVLGSRWREYRKEPLPDARPPEEDNVQQQQPGGFSSKRRQLPILSTHTVYRKSER
ncbi:hypothetical protein FRC17_007475 [Serendipita sp. 399]|nr:hypothetical protein FRC17_007475 [Serendipita sp. 399]